MMAAVQAAVAPASVGRGLKQTHFQTSVWVNRYEGMYLHVCVFPASAGLPFQGGSLGHT